MDEEPAGPTRRKGRGRKRQHRPKSEPILRPPRGRPHGERGNGEKRVSAEVEIAKAGLSRSEDAALRLAVAHPELPNSTIAKQLGMNPNGGVARRLGTNGDLRQYVRQLLAEQGWDDAKLIRRWGKQANAVETRHFSYRGKVEDTKKVAAHSIRNEALTNLTRLARLYPSQDEDQASRTSGPPSLVLQLNVGAPPAGAAPSGVTLTLDPTPEGTSDATAPPLERSPRRHDNSL